MSLPDMLGSLTSAGFSTTGVNTTDSTNWFPPPMTNTIPNSLGPLPPGTVVPIPYVPPRNIDFIDWENFYKSKQPEPDIPMAPPTNRRKIKLRD